MSPTSMCTFGSGNINYVLKFIHEISPIMILGLFNLKFEWCVFLGVDYEVIVHHF